MSVATVRRVVSRLEPDHPRPDAELVAAIAPASADREAAFAELVTRYGPMVFGVCRRVLADRHDAEDAFQAVFLVLARKAKSIRPPGAVGGWLHGVAVRTARKAKTAAARRRRREMIATARANPDRTAGAEADRAGDELHRAELRAAIDAELAALPEMQRAVVVLCELHGKTRAEAAAELNRPEGTVAGWLARGRKALAARLARRGFVLPAAGLGAVAVPAPVSAELVATALATFLGRGSAAVLILAEGVMRGLPATAKLATILVVGPLLVAVAVATATAWQPRPEPQPDAPPVPVAAPVPRDAGKIAAGAWKEKAVLDLTGWLGGSVVYSADGKTLFVGGTGGHVRAYEVGTFKKLWEYKGEEHFAAIALAPDGKTLALTTKDDIQFLDAATGKTGDKLEKIAEPRAVAFFPDDPIHRNGELLATKRQIIAGSASGYAVKTWLKWPNVSTITLNTLAAGQKPADEYAVPLAVAPDGKRVVSTGPLDKDTGKNVLWAWAAGSGAGNKLLAGHKAAVVAAAWSKDGKLMATGDADGVVITWDAATFKEKSRLTGNGRVAALAISADGTRVAAAVISPVKTRIDGYAEEVLVWPSANPKAVERIAHNEAGGPFKGVAALAFAPDGNSLAVAFANFAHLARLGELVGKVRIFALDAEKPQLPAKTVTHVECTPDGTKYLAVAGGQATVSVAATGKRLYSLDALAARFSADGKKLFVMGEKVLECDATTGKVVKTHDRPHTNWGWQQVAFAPDGKRYAVYFGTHTGVFDTATGKEVTKLKSQFETVGYMVGTPGRVMAFAPDGKTFAAAGVLITKDGLMGAAVWDLESGNRLHTFGNVDDSPRTFAFTPSGDELAVAYKDRVEVWVIRGEAKKNPVRKFPTESPATALAYSADGKQLAIGLRARSFDRWWADVREAYKGEVLVLNAATGETIRRLDAFKRDSVLIHSGKIKEEPTPDDRRGHDGYWLDPLVSALAFAPDGKTLLAGTGFPPGGVVPAGILKGGELKTFDLTAPEPPAPALAKWTDAAVLTDHGRLVNGVAVAPDGKSFAAATEGNVTCWDAATRKVLWTYKPSRPEAFALAYSPDGKYLCVATETDVTRLDAKTGKNDPWTDDNAIWFGQVKALAYHPAGKQLAASDGYVTRVRALEGKDNEAKIGTHPPGGLAPFRPAAVAWSKDGRRLALIHGGSEVTLWTVADGEKGVTLLKGHADAVICLAWSNDGQVIASGDEKGTVIAWDAATGKELWRRTFKGRDDTAGRINALALAPADNTVAVALSLGSGKQAERVVLLAGTDGKDVEHLMRAWSIPVASLAWAQDGAVLVTGCGGAGRAIKQSEPAVGEVVVWERKP